MPLATVPAVRVRPEKSSGLQARVRVPPVLLMVIVRNCPPPWAREVLNRLVRRAVERQVRVADPAVVLVVDVALCLDVAVDPVVARRPGERAGHRQRPGDRQAARVTPRDQGIGDVIELDESRPDRDGCGDVGAGERDGPLVVVEGAAGVREAAGGRGIAGGGAAGDDQGRRASSVPDERVTSLAETVPVDPMKRRPGRSGRRRTSARPSRRRTCRCRATSSRPRWWRSRRRCTCRRPA